MNTVELTNSLSAEQLAALLAFRDELLAANAIQNTELAAALKDDLDAAWQAASDALASGSALHTLLDAANESNASLTKQLTEALNANAGLGEQSISLIAQIGDLNAQLSAANANGADLQARLATTADALATSEKKLAAANIKLAAIDFETRTELQRAVDAQRAIVNTDSAQLTEAQAELDRLKSLLT